MSRIVEAVIIASNRGYKITKEGLIINPKGNELKGSYNNKSYKVFTIRINRQRSVSIPVHRLQAYQKYGEKCFEKGIHVRHLNSDPLDNSENNIAIGTATDNMMDRPKEQRIKQALHATSFIRKYDKEQVKDYFKEHGFTKAMTYFGISSKGTMSYIINH